jgi:hypothetical protein
MAHDVFISYSAKDKTTADVVCATLEANAVIEDRLRRTPPQPTLTPFKTGAIVAGIVCAVGLGVGAIAGGLQRQRRAKARYNILTKAHSRWRRR